MNQVVSGNEGNQGRRPPAEPEIEIIEEGGTAAPALPNREDKAQQATGQGYDYPDEDEGADGDSRTGAISGGGDTGQRQADQQQVSQQELTARQRRRARERDQRQRERAELFQLRRQVADLQSRFDVTDSRITSSEVAGLDSQIASVDADIARAGQVMSRAMAAQNSEDFEKAMRIRDALRDQLVGLKAQREQFEQNRTGGQQQQTDQGQAVAPNGMTAAQLQFARIFISRHPWYKHGSNDADSQMVVQLDRELTSQGSNPSTPEHWMELERRIHEDMPHKFVAQGEAGSDETQGGHKVNSGNGQANGAGNPKRAGGPKLPGSGNAGGSSNAGGGPVKFHLSAARKQALIDLGVWDQPEERMKHIKRFIEWDKANSGT